ncbi:MAG: hypothetical protein J2P17_21740 [Mycobacterium sp.]|nr:hypothetical protein [Mycobacterium sp.]
MELKPISYVSAVVVALGAAFAAPATASAQPDMHAAAGAVDPQFPEVSLCSNNKNYHSATVTGFNQGAGPGQKGGQVTSPPVALTYGQCSLVSGYWWDRRKAIGITIKDPHNDKTIFPVDLNGCATDTTPGKNIRKCRVD